METPTQGHIDFVGNEVGSSRFWKAVASILVTTIPAFGFATGHAALPRRKYPPAVRMAASATNEQLVQVWDGIFAPSALQKLSNALDDHGSETGLDAYGSHSIFDRKQHPEGRTIIEYALVSILEAMGDDTQYLEYWWRGGWKNMEAHRDVDEALCHYTSQYAKAGKSGKHRCPLTGHVLYVDIGKNVLGPTCLWEEAEPDADEAFRKQALRESTLGGPPRELQRLYAVPCKPGRLLRFRGDMLHAVPKPSLTWLESSQNDDFIGSARRSVLLFNLWDKAPTEPPSLDDAPANSLLAKAAWESCKSAWGLPACLPMKDWTAAQRHNGPELFSKRDDVATLATPLLGTFKRHGSKTEVLKAKGPADALRQALLAESIVSSVPLRVVEQDDADADALMLKKAEALLSDEGIPVSLPRIKEINDMKRKSNEGNDSSPRILTMHVDEIELSTRVVNCLKKANISTVGDLLTKSEEEMLSYRNFGKKSLDEIKQKLEQRNLALGMKTDALFNQGHEPSFDNYTSEVRLLLR